MIPETGGDFCPKQLYLQKSTAFRQGGRGALTTGMEANGIRLSRGIRERFSIWNL